MNEKVAIIGGGIAGLTAAYLLNRKYDITLFEKNECLGGNAHTIDTRDGLTFDIAVAVFGKNSYSNFYKLLQEVNVKTCRFSAAGLGMRNLDTKEKYYMTSSVMGMINQRFDMFKPKRLLKMAMGWKVNVTGKEMYEAGELGDMSLEEFFNTQPPTSKESLFMRVFLLCLLTSMYFDEVMKAPASFIFGKMIALEDFFTHRALWALFQAEDKTQSYVNALASYFEHKIILNSKIKKIVRNEEEVLIHMNDGSELHFNKVVFACNADQVLKLLDKPTDEENNLLGKWKYKDGPIVVHKDWSSFPSKEQYALFSFLYTNGNDKVHTSVNGHIRNLKNIPNNCKYIGSQHPNFPIDEDLIEYKRVFRTPIFDKESVATIKDLPTLNGKENTHYCGSHFGYGLHEDAVTSAIKVASYLGVEWH